MPRLSIVLATGAFVLALAACGDSQCNAPEEGGPAVGDAPDLGAAPVVEEASVLIARTSPLAPGDVAPGFAGLPAGPAVVVFYRGHW